MRRLLDRAFDTTANSRIITPEVIGTFYFPHRCELWRPKAMTVGPDKEAVDVYYVLAVPSEPCMLIATPEREQSDIEGRTKVTNIFTDDKFLFRVGSPVEDTWCIKVTSGAGVDDAGRTWIVQGNPQPQDAFPFQLTPVQMVYGKTSPPPVGVSGRG